ncbi:hypothetical protein GCM10017608_21270 [Agromyces luteolus]|uniref:DUF7363 domain-containing protein n=1 Tax=Agromyces luteolus TaxID=88373 RepID=A0A7C9LGK4_9MICO|nr:hypothetical protein [Agromyces luteolus]MUN08830.1 hypothetical protein [Agromyces luteolus]GLK28193.1 hypothetical protein GCM10017608_21270 [Agromyces luteolus]
MPQDGRVAQGVAAAHLQAELTPIVTVGSTATLTVRLVRADAASTPGAPAPVDGEAGRIAAGGPVTVTVVPRGLRFLVGARRSRLVRLPSATAAEARFTMLAVDRGPAEVTVLVRGDGELPLATLRLTSEVVGSDDHDQAGVARATARIAAADPLIACRPTLRIDEEVARGRSILHAALCVGDEAHRFRIRLADKARLVGEVRASLARAKEVGATLPAAERADAVERGLREVGAGLADRLLDRRARDLLWAHRDRLDGLVVQTTGETELPWELLVVRRPGAAATDADAFLGEFGLTRWLYDVTPPAAVRLSSTTDAAGGRPATAVASASVVALGSDEGAAEGAAAAMRNGAGVVVECGGSGGRSALSETFLATFSAELAGGAPVDRASRRAREAARAAGEACAVAYAVYGHPDARARAA